MLDNFSRCEQCDGTGLRMLRNRVRWNARLLVARVTHLSIRKERAMVSWGGLSMPSPQSRPAPLILTL
jgi:hypothetical protein